MKKDREPTKKAITLACRIQDLGYWTQPVWTGNEWCVQFWNDRGDFIGTARNITHAKYLAGERS